MLPALTLGIFAVPGAASADNGMGGVATMVMVSNTNTGVSMTEVASVANSGGNVIMSSASSVGGNSGNSRDVTADARASTGNTAMAEVEGEGEEGETEVEGETSATGNSSAYAAANSATGNGGSAGRSVTVNTIVSGDAKSDVLVMGGTDHNEVDIDVTDDCECDRANEYYEQYADFYEEASSSEYEDYYTSSSEEGETEGCEGECEESEYEFDSETSNETGSEEYEQSQGSMWSVYEKTYVPVKTMIMVQNENTTLEGLAVLSASDSGNNAILAASASVGGTSGDSEDVHAGAGADTHNTAMAEVEGEGEEGETEVEGETHAGGNSDVAGLVQSTTGDGGSADDSTSDNMVLTGRSDSIVTIIKTSRHNVVRIVR